MARLALALDSSTQSLSSIVVDIDTAEKVLEHSLDYRQDDRTNVFGIGSDYIIPPRVEGEADQPIEMILASVDAMFDDLRTAGVAVEDIVLINNSGQQHGHVYLNNRAENRFARLRERGCGELSLVRLLRGSFSYLTAPIWMTSNTANQADCVRHGVGGKGEMIRLSGSDSPLRFTGAVVRRVAEQFPDVYRATENIQLISSLIPSILTGNSKTPIDYGNACGMSLMDYSTRIWSRELLNATSKGLLGGGDALIKKLPNLVPPDSVVGNIGMYFVEKYGFHAGCKVIAGSGDNPQAKTLVEGDLLSLGTSFVNMVSTDGNVHDMSGMANAMYDGVGRPFMFGCRTNGALVWDQIRALYGLGKEDYQPAESALKAVTPGSSMTFWQPKTESFPPSGSFDIIRKAPHIDTGLGLDYSGVIETSLAAVYVHSKQFTGIANAPLHVTGGATHSPEIMRRVAAIWNRKIVPIEKGGPALGAAVAGIHAYYKSRNEPFSLEDFNQSVLRRSQPIVPRAEDATVFHSPRKYLERFISEEAKILAEHPVR
ncbi:MAG: FGGY family carbohydrate kinase [Candidatus Poribacteria bacterium]|nr:FGGY family carbohydrate kinase [Candidatus Poribacteria bacterium]MDE0504338.1 FGGY family carbohydrate kinase [Candidatus Poribacteria bacterium]